MKKSLITSLVILGLLLAASFIWWRRQEALRISAINSFTECAEAGFPILEIYPEQCQLPDGRMFIRPI